jgi:hypothetical protein
MAFPYGLYDFENQILKPQIKINGLPLVYSNSLKVAHKDLLSGIENQKQYNDILFFQNGLLPNERSSFGLFGFENNFIIILLGYDFGVEAFDTLEISFENINNPDFKGTLVDFSLAAYFGSNIIFDNHNFGDVIFYENQLSNSGLVLSNVDIFPQNRNSIAKYEFFFEIFNGIFESTKIIIEFDNNFINLINGSHLVSLTLRFSEL